jgi:molybdopterin/thiamine biosynthesis adenylyltransferase
VGVGSGGSMIAVELAKAGVGKFVLIDRDRLEVANVTRHACGLGDVGRLKTLAVRDLIQARNPAAAVETHEFDILEDPQRLREVVSGCDLLIGATDSDPSRALVNRVAVEQRIIALFGRVLTGAYSGDVLRVRPHAGACLGCIFTAAVREARRSEISGMRQARERLPDYTDEAQLEQAIQVGLASDIAPVAMFMVKLALTELLRGQAGALASLEMDFKRDFYTWVNRREDLYRDFKPLGEGLPTILSWIPVSANRRPECSVCGSGTFASAGVPIEPSAGPAANRQS